MLIAIIIIFSSLVLSVALVGFIQLILKSNEAYKMAVNFAANNRTIRNLLGKPVKPAFFIAVGVGGNLVKMRVPLIGSRRMGKLEFHAQKVAGSYVFKKLEFQCGAQTFDFLADIQNIPKQSLNLQLAGKILLSKSQF